jgi:hypothetical protein
MNIKNNGTSERRISANQNKHAVVVSPHGRQPMAGNVGTNLNSTNVANFSATHITNPLQRKVG